MKDPAHVWIKLVIHTQRGKEKTLEIGEVGRGGGGDGEGGGAHDYNPAAARGSLDIPPRKFFEIAPEAFWGPNLSITLTRTS